jgi:hypothetical protein
MHSEVVPGQYPQLLAIGVAVAVEVGVLVAAAVRIGVLVGVGAPLRVGVGTAARSRPLKEIDWCGFLSALLLITIFDR